MTLDGRRLSPPEGFLIRKAPGNDSFDFGQFVDFSPGSNSVNTPVLRQAQARRFDDKENESVRSCVVLAGLQAIDGYATPLRRWNFDLHTGSIGGRLGR